MDGCEIEKTDELASSNGRRGGRWTKVTSAEVPDDVDSQSCSPVYVGSVIDLFCCLLEVDAFGEGGGRELVELWKEKSD